MKNLFKLLISSVLLLLFFNSCQKDGIYTPKKKISAIYEHRMGVKNIMERWHWHDNKILQIDNYFNNQIEYSAKFLYENKRLSTIKDGYSTYNFYYKGNRLDYIDVSSEGIKDHTIYIKKTEGKNITHIQIEDHGFQKNKINHKNSHILKLLISEDCSLHFSQLQKRILNSKTSQNITNLYLTYQNNNVSKEVWHYDDGEIDSYTYQYDKKKNPFINSLQDLFGGSLEFCMAFSENNVISASNTDDEILTYTYDYDGQYPIARYHDSHGYRYVIEFEYK